MLYSSYKLGLVLVSTLLSANVLSSPAVDRYINHNNGTITDKNTGLMWKQCEEGKTGQQCETGKENLYTWNEAVESFKDVHFANYDDWRLPTISELRSLVYCGNGVVQREALKETCYGKSSKSFTAPSINTAVFPHTTISTLKWWVWSSSRYSAQSNAVWYVDFNSGYSTADDKSVKSLVRLVRHEK